MRKYFLLSATALAFAALTATGKESSRHFKPKDGYVPDAETAIKIAVAVWEPIYGAEKIAKERPYHAFLYRDTSWVVKGSRSMLKPGGVATAVIGKEDGRIFGVSHGK